MLNVYDRHHYFLPALERQARGLKGEWLLACRAAYYLLLEVDVGPHAGALGHNLVQQALRVAELEAKLASIRWADTAVATAWPDVELQPWRAD